MKRIVSFALVLIMMLGLSTACFADSDDLIKFEPETTQMFMQASDDDTDWLGDGKHRAALALFLLVDLKIADEEMDELVNDDALYGAYVSRVFSDEKIPGYGIMTLAGSTVIAINYYPSTGEAGYLTVPRVTKSTFKATMKEVKDCWAIDEDDMDDVVKIVSNVLNG